MPIAKPSVSSHVDLAPYAVSAEETKGRKVEEPEPQSRTCFQRDRDRILHSRAFRRLQYKTQVFVNHEGDHYRTRLTHTLETSQMARSIARTLRLNEDLVEAIALAHDIGHGPFGHAGEWALRAMMQGHGGFDHNEHALRIVELLEDIHPEYTGLNLSYETLEGLKKYPEKAYINGPRQFRSLEADLVDLSDEIAYSCHDLDDGLRSGFISLESVEGLDLWVQASQRVKTRFKALSNHHLTRLVIKEIVNLLINNAVEWSQGMIKKTSIETVQDIQSYSEPIISLSPEMCKAHLQLKRFLRLSLYQHHLVIRMTQKGQRFIRDIFEVYLEDPRQLPPSVYYRIEEEGVNRAICDYLAGMTDRFVFDEHKRLFDPYD